MNLDWLHQWSAFEHLQLAWPWLLLTLPLPIIVYWLLPAATASTAALRVPFLADFQLAESTQNRSLNTLWYRLFASLAWLLLVIASSRPQWLADPIEIPLHGRDLLLAVDLSGSMREKDFMLEGKPIDRLVATQWVASDFIQRRVGDRVGLILFGERAYLQTPLTFDRKTVSILLNEAVIGLAGANATAIGDAIGLALKRLRHRRTASQVLILLTDGIHNAGELTPKKAAELAAELGVKIYTIGLGAETMLVRDVFGSRRINPSRDLDEKTLQMVAQITGGRYFRAKDTQALAGIYQLLDQLEPIEQETQLFRPQKELYPWPLGAALLLSMLLLLVRPSRSL